MQTRVRADRVSWFGADTCRAPGHAGDAIQESSSATHPGNPPEQPDYLGRVPRPRQIPRSRAELARTAKSAEVEPVSSDPSVRGPERAVETYRSRGWKPPLESRGRTRSTSGARMIVHVPDGKDPI